MDWRIIKSEMQESGQWSLTSPSTFAASRPNVQIEGLPASGLSHSNVRLCIERIFLAIRQYPQRKIHANHDGSYSEYPKSDGYFAEEQLEKLFFTSSGGLDEPIKLDRP